MATTLKPVVSDMLIFKKVFHRDGQTVFQSFSKKEGLKQQSKLHKGKLSKKMKGQLVAANIAGMEVAMMVNSGTARRSDAVTRVVSLFADFDSGKQTKEQLLKLQIKPHLIVETSPRKFHAYWLIKDCDLKQFSRVMKALAEKLGSDPKVCDLVRVMRMPGTYNHKYKPPFLAKIVHQKNDAKPIRLEFFKNKMELKVDSGVVAVSKTAEQTEQKSDMSAVQIKAALSVLSPEDRDTWLKVGKALHSNDPTETSYALWTGWAKGSEKYDETEHRKMWDEFVVGKGITIKSVFWMANLAKQGPLSKLSEGSLATLFAESFKDVLCYDPDEKSWYYFNGVVWVVDSQAPYRYAREMTHGLKAAMSESATDNSLKGFLTVAAFRSIVSHAELLPELQINSLVFDTNPNLLAVQNGVIDLSTGLFRQATATDYLRRQANVAFDIQAKCPEWLNYMKAATCGDKELSEFIRRVIGYILIGRADMQLFFWALGSGSNGKGVLMRAMKALLGEYGIAVLPNLLTSAYSSNANAPTPALAVLRGARFVICTEMIGRKLDEAFIKQFAGGDEITARHGYGSVFTFKPEGKLFLSSNYKDIPDISANDEAMWRRLVPIPFNAKFIKGDNDDGKLDEKLALEFSGILNWMLRGAKAYLTNGLGSCSAVDDMKLKLRKDADSLLAWMSGCCKNNSKTETQSSEAYESYKTFMRHSERKALSIQAFRTELMKKGFMPRRGSSCNYYTGFRLLK